MSERLQLSINRERELKDKYEWEKQHSQGLKDQKDKLHRKYIRCQFDNQQLCCENNELKQVVV